MQNTVLQYIRLSYTATILIVSLLLHGCCNSDEPSGNVVPDNSAILISAQTEASFARTSLPAGMYDNFKVYVVAEKDAQRIEVMNGYKVQFATDHWSYLVDDQSLVFWIGSADRYLFTAGAPFDKVSAIDESTITLNLANNTTGSVMVATPLSIEKGTDEFGKIVNLHFGYAHCRVCVAFVKDSATDVAIENISLTPQAPITAAAELTYSYDWSTTPPTTSTSLTADATSDAGFTYADVTIPAGSSDAIQSATYYYCVPDATNPVNWTISLTLDGSNKSSDFVNTMIWESGKSYTYIFSLEGKTPKLIHVTSQDMTFYCNDIIPGDVFDNSHMTE